MWRLGSMCSGFRPVLAVCVALGSLQRLVLFLPHRRVQASEKHECPTPCRQSPPHTRVYTHTHTTSLPRDQVPPRPPEMLMLSVLLSPCLSPHTQPWGQLGCVMASGGSCPGDRMTLICFRAAAGASGAGSALTHLVTHQLPTPPPGCPPSTQAAPPSAPSSREALCSGVHSSPEPGKWGKTNSCFCKN